MTGPLDWRLPVNRREAFQRFYSFHLKYGTHPGCVYPLLPAIAEAFDLDEEQRCWLVWLNGNTQNVVTSLLLLEAAPHSSDWQKAVSFWNDNFTQLEWDTDRRHQKNRFGEATEDWFFTYGASNLQGWLQAGQGGWKSTWEWAFGQPHMGRLSAWSMIEYARILLGHVIPDSDTWLLEDKSGSRSHRNGIAVVKGYDAAYWAADVPDMLGIVPELEAFADELLAEAQGRNLVHEPSCRCTAPYDQCEGSIPHPDVSRLSMESALCTYKGWHKPNRRYPNVYADMMYNRIKKAETRFGRTLDVLWDARKKHLPEYLRLEDNPRDPGLSSVKQNWYLTTGHVPMMSRDFPDMQSGFDDAVRNHTFDPRKDPKWS